MRHGHSFAWAASSPWPRGMALTAVGLLLVGELVLSIEPAGATAPGRSHGRPCPEVKLSKVGDLGEVVVDSLDDPGR
jgi:hypothetical protein